MRLHTAILFLLISTSIKLVGQTDTVKYQWPISPLGVQKQVTGTFAEYRSTSASGHYHNGTDIPASAGTPVYAVLPGVVAVAYDDGSTGYDSYVRVTSTINGVSKNLTYYHTRPSVSVGQQVVIGQQISTIAIDHVHLIDYNLGTSLTDRQINALRQNGGLTPYVDTWKPRIRYIKFLLDNSTTFVPMGGLGSKIDIIVHIEEANGTSSSAQNNGAYQVGYKILNVLGDSVVFNPPDNGSRYIYNNKPKDQYVNINFYQPESNTSQHVYSITNGGGANYVASTQVVANNFWDVTQHPYGNYKLMVWTTDCRGNADTQYVNITTTDIDLIPPGQANLRYVKMDSTGYFTIGWRKPADPDLKGYRLFYSSNGTGYSLREDENILKKDVLERTYSYGSQNPLYLKVSSVDSATMPNLGIQSDVYGIRMKNDGNRILIVDGFNRYGGTGSWANPYHEFILRYADAFSYSFDSAHNSEVENGGINLSTYNAVIWFLGDESTEHETISDAEKVKIADYLDNGGKLFISGSEIAYDLEGSGSAASGDITFLRNYLRAKYVMDNSNSKVVAGADGTVFSGLSNIVYGLTGYGSPYVEDYPDAIDTVNGSQIMLKYSTLTNAGIAYTGAFGNPNKTGQVVYFAFPFETVGYATDRTNLMSAVFNYFGISTDVENHVLTPEVGYSLEQNYPNPFNPSTVISYSLPQKQHVTIKVYDIMGKEITKLVDEEKGPGKFLVEFNAADLASGVYFYQLTTNDFSSVRKLILMK
ncbi:MAG: T9SS type A sorting domain-containing protein [Ignavibacteriales bacterium]|nr:T9SS type A sorting domain-containing protein [Ignavibacteriales bacterium]